MSLLFNEETLKLMKEKGVNKPDSVPQEMWDSIQLETNQLVELVPVSNNGVVTYTHEEPKAFGWDDMEGQGMSVDVMLKLKSGGVPYMGTEEIKKDPFIVEVDFSQTKIKKTIKCSVGGETKYFHTYDGYKCTDGSLWSESVNYCKTVDKDSYDFMSTDLVFTLLEDVKGDEGQIVSTAGTLVGHSTPSTGRKNMIAFCNECKEKGIDIVKGKAKAKLSFEKKENKNYQSWRVLKLELVD